MKEKRMDAIEPYYHNEKYGVTIYNADCREVLPQLEPVDLVLTDPPYGIGEAAGKNKSRNQLAKAKDYGIANWDNETKDSEVEMAVSVARNAIVFGGNYYNLGKSSCWLVWDKDNSGDFADCELAWTNLKKAVRKFKWRWNGMLQELSGGKKETRHHPTQKPLALMKWCIKQAGEPQTILDPFMGSGTTLVAAKQLGRKAIGIEIEEKYCEIAVERLRQGVFQFEEVQE